MERVVVTGMGVVSSIGLDVDTFWTHLLEGASYMVPFSELSHSTSEHVWWSPVGEDFRLNRWLSDPKLIRRTDRFSQYVLAAVAQAVQQAGIGELPSLRTAVILGTTMGGVPTLLEVHHQFGKLGPDSVPARLMATIIPNMASAQVAMHWRLHGPQMTLTAACASSLDAIGMASRLIEQGTVDVAIAGGMDNLLAPVVTVSLAHAGALSHALRASEASRPFDRARDGFVMGEGAGIVLLESEAFANRRQAAVYGRVRGHASLADSYHVTSPDPEGTWQALTMRMALEDGMASPSAVDAVIAHGTGTPVGDAAEIRAINQVFGECDCPVPVTSIKGHMGHTMGASGVMSVITAIQCMMHRTLPMTLNTRVLDPAIAFDVVTETPRRQSLEVMLINAFGFGGQNASVVVTRS